jgi:hypothetical protein
VTHRCRLLRPGRRFLRRLVHLPTPSRPCRSLPPKHWRHRRRSRLGRGWSRQQEPNHRCHWRCPARQLRRGVLWKNPLRPRCSPAAARPTATSGSVSCSPETTLADFSRIRTGCAGGNRVEGTTSIGAPEIAGWARIEVVRAPTVWEPGSLIPHRKGVTRMSWWPRSCRGERRGSVAAHPWHDSCMEPPRGCAR